MREEFFDPKSFQKNGFVIIRNIFSDQEVEDLRALCLSLIDEYGSKRQLMPSETLDNQELRLLPFNKKIVNSLRISLGKELAYIPDFTLHSNQFGVPGWHTDSGSEIYQPYLQSPDYKFAKCGVYLQDNTESWGGGIEVLPKGHKYPLKSNSIRLNSKIKTTLNKFMIPFKKITLEIKAGDFVYFDSRLPHSSTFHAMLEKPKKEGTYHFPEIPKENSKLILYWDACSIDMSKPFIKNSLKRSLLEESTDSYKENPEKELFFSDYIKLYYPEDYPDDFTDLATKSSVYIASFEKNECLELNKNYKDKIMVKTTS